MKYPLGFDRWPRQSQLEWCDVTFTRAGLIKMVLAHADVHPRRHVDRDTKVRKHEFAHLHLELEGIASEY